MSKAVTVKGRLADPRHVELEEPVTDLLGPVEVVLRAVVESSNDSPAKRVERARALQAGARSQSTDSVDLLREDRQR
jgi:hypothetical protein